MINFFEKLLNLIYIQTCFFCKSKIENGIICSRCYNKIHFMPPAVLKEKSGCKIYACCLYDEVIKKLIKDLKYHNQKTLAHLQAQLMFEYWQQLKINEEYIILPVPIHENRRKERKYNHMDLTADDFSKLTNLKVNKNFLIRVKDTKKQFNLHKRERIQNIKNAFAINQNEHIDKNTKLLIIDDITSTGITLEEIIKLLKSNGFKEITAIALSTPDIWN